MIEPSLTISESRMRVASSFLDVIYEDIDPLVPFALSASGIDFLYEELGNDFIVITDDLASKVLKAEYSLAGTVVMAAKAGVDMLLISGNEPNDAMEAYEAILNAVRDGEIPEETIGAHARKIIEAKTDSDYSSFSSSISSLIRRRTLSPLASRACKA